MLIDYIILAMSFVILYQSWQIVRIKAQLYNHHGLLYGIITGKLEVLIKRSKEKHA